jgi:hypothetical protein
LKRLAMTIAVDNNVVVIITTVKRFIALDPERNCVRNSLKDTLTFYFKNLK